MATEATENAELVQENIEEYINDENKVVTYRWLSLTLELNINTAKSALYSYVEAQRNKGGNDDVNVTYFVAGLGESKSGQQMHKCVVVPESELDAVKKSLSTVTSCHIYSVQKAKLKDYTPLFATDYDVIKDNIDKCSRHSAIECSWATQKPQNQTVKRTEKTDTTVKTEKNGNLSTPPSNTVASKASTKKVEPKGSISSMFAKAGGKGKPKETTDKQSMKTDQDKGEKQVNKAPDKKTGMKSYFGKQGAGDTGTATAESTKAKRGKTGSKEDERNKARENQATNKQTGKKKKAADSDDEGGPDRKRRRRIQTEMFDSSSEDDGGNSEEEENMEPEIEVEDSPPIGNDSKEPQEENDRTSPAKRKDEETREQLNENGNSGSGKRRKGRMKTVSKQYVDEEGFMVTKKVSEWESGSDLSDEETDSAKEIKTKDQGGKAGTDSAHHNDKTKEKPAKGKQAPKKPAASPQKGKQTSLMSFFKKK